MAFDELLTDINYSGTICMSEHSLFENEVAYINISGYKLIKFYCRSKYKVDGLLIYIRSGFWAGRPFMYAVFELLLSVTGYKRTQFIVG